MKGQTLRLHSGQCEDTPLAAAHKTICHPERTKSLVIEGVEG